MTRGQHLEWCKKRAIEYVNQGDLDGAMASFLSDMQKHDETKDHLALMMLLTLKANGHLDTPKEMQEFIEGFN